MTRRRSLGVKTLLILGQLFLVLAVLLYAVEYAALDKNCYAKLHEETGATAATGLTDAGVARADEALIRFLRGEPDALTYEDQVYAQTQRVFHDREITHMQDVLRLFQAGRIVRGVALFLGILLCVVGLCLNGRDVKGLFRALRVAALIVLGLLVCLCVWGIADFSGVFLRMHALLFDNDLWLMNPETDLMIRLLPEGFFMGIARNIAIYAASSVLAMLGIGCLLGGKKKCAK